MVKDARLVPPLVTGLFHGLFAGILNEYPLAESVAPDIRIATASGQVGAPRRISVRSFGTRPMNTFAAHFTWFRSISSTCCSEVSKDYAPHPDNYDRLVSEALRLDRVAFVTLNYDTLLDKRLEIHAPINAMSDYVSTTRKWSLVKLHGSVDWGRRLANQDDYPEHNRILSPLNRSDDASFLPRTLAQAR